MTAMDDALESVFDTLFVGAGMPFGLLLFIAIAVGIVVKWKVAGIVVIPLILVMEVTYYDGLVASGDMNNAYGMMVLIVLIVFIAWRMLLKKGD